LFLPGRIRWSCGSEQRVLVHRVWCSRQVHRSGRSPDLGR
jgi:hypothetical protein